eukprot:296515-Hanusia_phi.AAC.1
MRDVYHSILVLDRSGSMAGQDWEDLKLAVDNFVDVMRDHSRYNLISIVVFNSSFKIACVRANADDSPQACLDEISPDGGTSFSQGLQGALQVLQGSDVKSFQNFLLFMSDGQSSDGEVEMQVTIPPSSQ